MSGLGPEASAITITPEIEQALRAADIEGMKTILHAAAISQGLVTPDPLNNEILHETELSKNAKTRVRERTINGQTYELRGATEAELDALETQLYRELMSPAPVTQEQQPVQQVRDTQGRFVAGDQNTSDAAIEDYLQRNGIDLSAVRDQHYVTDWQSATNEFLARHGDYAGGQQNLEAIGNAIRELGLEDSPSADSLEQAFLEVQRRGLYQTDTAEARAARAAQQISGAVDHESIRSLGRTALGLPSSSEFFGR